MEYKWQCEKFRPVFQHYFAENFYYPTEWCKYTYSLTTSSIVGHNVGFGERYVQNILTASLTRLRQS